MRPGRSRSAAPASYSGRDGGVSHLRRRVSDGFVIGDKSTLEQAVAGRIMASGGVRRRVPKRRAKEDEDEDSTRWFLSAVTGRHEKQAT
jgi:hypothetical protein